MKARARASARHFLLTLAVAGIVGTAIFLVWFPYPFRDISGGRHLFFIVVAVDAVIGPAVTFAVFNPAKGWPVLKKDLLVVALLQLAALAYGCLTVYNARPVHVIYEYDRFRVVHAGDIRPDALDEALLAYRDLPVTGPSYLSLRKPNEREKQEYMLADIMNGEGLSSRPALWQPYDAARSEVLRQARPIAALKQHLPAEAGRIEAEVKETGRPATHLVYAPLVGRDEFWTVLLDARTAEPLRYIPLDPF